MLKKQIDRILIYIFLQKRTIYKQETSKLGNKYIFADTYTFDATRDSNPRP